MVLVVVEQVIRERIDLPGIAVGVVDPDLVLLGVAAGRVHLIEGRQPGCLKPGLHREDLMSPSPIPGVYPITHAPMRRRPRLTAAPAPGDSCVSGHRER